jgi:hypothetical protein
MLLYILLRVTSPANVTRYESSKSIKRCLRSPYVTSVRIRSKVVTSNVNE